ncbi:MAG: DNA cytosine methyltransferase [Clostridiales Family XIII bacterium]|jgi:DNA (cytosine-5)-methyltransferase 1|nr:DNA cytosine methyltransferase [Clostridiales Family XIII bacterium]
MNRKTAPVTLGSLFDGIGAVPLAASYFGIKTLWASEIAPNAVSVTRRHFPEMAHLGDITKLDGGKIPPVDIVAFGSPCQSFSIAAGGSRTGFRGKSGLFTEAVRIIREMREKSHGNHPKIALFENVIGLFSSGKGSYAGRDYQTVLEAFAEAEIPMPRSDKWANAGMVRGNGFDLAWIVKDAAKHYRVPQRRRRLFVVVDFTGARNRAGEILFVPQSLSGYFAARESERQGTPAHLGSGAFGAGGAGFNGWRSASGSIEYAEERSPTITASMPPDVVVGAFMAGQHESARSIAYNEEASPTLKDSPSGLNQVPCVVEPRIARALTARHDSSPCADRGQNIVAFAQNRRNELRDLGETAVRLAADPGVKQQTHIANEKKDCLNPWDTQQARIHTPDGLSPTLASADGGGGRRPGGLVMIEAPAVGVHQNQAGELAVSDTAYTLSASSNASARNAPLVAHPETAGTLCASGVGLSRPAGMGSEPDLCVAYCLQGNMIGRQDLNGPQGGGVNEEIGFTLSAADKHCVAAADRRNLKETGEAGGTLRSECMGGRSPDHANPIRTGYVIRRLTPLECERLMALPDGWTQYGHDGKAISDGARYRMCGNSIVVNVLAYIMQNIAAFLGKDGEPDG